MCCKGNSSQTLSGRATGNGGSILDKVVEGGKQPYAIARQSE